MSKNGHGKIQIAGGGPAWDEELRLWLEGHINRYPHLTTAVLESSTHVGMSRTALDSYLKCTYFDKGDGKGVKKSGLEPAIREYRERVEGPARDGVRNSFVKTPAWVQFQHAVQTAINDRAIVIAYSEPGVGKSRCMREYSYEKMTTLPIQVLCSANITTRHFVQKIAQAIGLDDRPPTARLEDNIAAKLKSHPRPLFVDQANYLNEKGLGSVCYLWEVARIPIVLIGTKDLFDLFNSSRMTQDVRAQLSSRVAMQYPLASMGLDQVKAICERTLGDAATPQVVAKIFQVTKGNHRALEFIFPRIADLAKVKDNAAGLRSGEVSMEKIIDAAGARLMVA